MIRAIIRESWLARQKQRLARIRTKFAASAVERWFFVHRGHGPQRHRIEYARAVRYEGAWYAVHGKRVRLVVTTRERATFATETAARTFARKHVQKHLDGAKRDIVMAEKDLRRFAAGWE